MNLFGGRRMIEPAHMDRIKSWVRAAWALPDDTTVMVTELECREPGCPPIETVIVRLEGPGQTIQHKIHKPVAEIVQSDVEALANGEEPPHAH